MTSKTWWSTTPDILQRYDRMNRQTDTYFCSYCISGSHKGLYTPGVLRTQWYGNDTCNTKVRLWNDQMQTTTQTCERNMGKEINRNVLMWQSKGFGCTTDTKQGYRVFYMSYLWRLYNLWLAQTQIMSWSALSLSDDAFVRSAKVQQKGRFPHCYIYVLCENIRAQSAAWIVPLFARQNITHLMCKGPNACFIHSARKL